jgi:hypothetical protein
MHSSSGKLLCLWLVGSMEWVNGGLEVTGLSLYQSPKKYVNHLASKWFRIIK